MRYVTDTHSIVWYFLDDQRLSTTAREAIERTVDEGKIVIPAVVLAEMLYITEKGRVTLSFRETLDMVQRATNYEISPLNVSVVKETARFGEHLEMHDRLIVATARLCDAPLITCDGEITKSNLVETIW